ncbi:MAG: hypothetical protein ACKVVT_17415, partial [Dehalococcoidia bacterium]
RSGEDDRHTSVGGAELAERGSEMAVRAYVLIEADQTRVQELREMLPGMELDGSRVTRCDVVAGPYDLVCEVESTDLTQLGH